MQRTKNSRFTKGALHEAIAEGIELAADKGLTRPHDISISVIAVLDAWGFRITANGEVLARAQDAYTNNARPASRFERSI